LKGLRNPIVALVGTYYQRPDWQEIELELCLIKAKILPIE